MQIGERTRRREAARKDLTETAIDCFSRYGYHATSIDRIAKDAGVTKGAIYYHFRDKDDLLAAAVLDRIAEFETRVQSACGDVDCAEGLRRIANVCVEHARSGDRPRFAIKLMVESIDTHDHLREQMRGMMRRFRAFLRNIVRAGQDQGLFRRDVDADVVAAAYTSAVIGAETQFYLDPDRFSLERTLGLFVDQLLDNLRPDRDAQDKGEHRD
ncbi:MAG TPA: TetR/AcrR family transcriptional regulator [Candidatus Limnocylindrales bacterium]|nr:TetR/AcrR family transcriptional regulator [Candidatus Limnocylindrales bacterium]